MSIEKNNPRDKPDGFDHLVYIRLFEGCNLHCKHCFIPSNPKKMSLEQMADLPRQLSEKIGTHKTVLLQWHGGEPTALGPDYIEKGLKAINEQAETYDLTIIHSIQTNLTTYDERWRDIFKTYFEGSIGVSWDPKIRMYSSKRPETNADYEAVFWKNLKKAIDDGISPYLVVTGTRTFFETFRTPSDFIELLERNRISHVHIERLTKTGYARDNWGEIGLSNREYSEYMRRFSRMYHQYKKTSNAFVSMSPFDGLFESVDRLISGESGGYGCLSGSCDTRFHTFDANGYKHGCTAINSESDNKNASVQVIQFTDLTTQRAIRQKSCEGCTFKPICSSGCLASSKWDESEECSGASILFEDILRIKQTA